jgi:dihydroxyacetone kinase-like predicted kinase
MVAVFNDLGVDSMVEGGQTMNPSTEDIIRAINRTPSEIVYVLPNNKNIYMAAKQAEYIVTDKKVVVLKTHTIPQGISAMLAFDFDAEEADNTAAMKEAMKKVTTAKLTFAARDSSFDGMDIKEGQILGLVENDVKYVCDSREDCLTRIAEDIKDKDYITLFYGEGIDENEANAAAEVLQSVIGNSAEITVINGGQPVYYYVISAENA